MGTSYLERQSLYWNGSLIYNFSAQGDNATGSRVFFVCFFVMRSALLIIIMVYHNTMLHTAQRKLNSLQWRHNEHDGVSNHQRLDCLLNRLFRRRPMKTSKLCVTGLCEGNSPVTDEFPAQRASNAERVYTWWRHYVIGPWKIRL